MTSLEGCRAFVTGGAGHIGSHVVDELIKVGAARIVVYDNLCEGRDSNLAHLEGDPRVELVRDDIRDYEDLDAAMKGSDIVFHVASVLLLECRDRPYKALEVNVKGTYNVLRAAVQHGVKKVVFSSTGSVYGEPLRLPMDEDHPYNSETLYGTTKIAGEHLCRDFYREHGLAFVGLRYFNVYGPRQHYKGAYAQIVPRWFDKIEDGEPLEIFGDGSQTMDMTFVEDIARANIAAAQSEVAHDFFNVGTGKSTSVLQVAEYMMDITGSKLPIKFTPRDINLVKRRQCSTERAKTVLGFEATVGVREGLERYFDWRRQMASLRLEVAARAS